MCEGRVPRWMQRVEAPLFKLAGVAPGEAMRWRSYALALLAFNALGVFFVYALQRLQGGLPFNAAGLGGGLARLGLQYGRQLRHQHQLAGLRR